MANPNEKDDILFEQLQRSKRRKRRKTVTTVLVLVLLAAAGIFLAVNILRARVQERFASAGPDVKSYQATVGRISTTVSGSGVLDTVDAQQITVPEGVEIDEVLISAGDTLKAGDPVARVSLASVMDTLSSTQKALEDLDNQLSGARDDRVGSRITAGINARVKVIYAQKGDNVVDCMTEHGALAILSLDGYMCVTVSGTSEPGTAVTVMDENGKTWPGTVETAAPGSFTVLLTDNGPLCGSELTVLEGETALGTGTLEIHNPIAVTGYAGTISNVSVKENQQVYSGTALFTLTDTTYSANYDALLQTRAETEEELNTLITLLRTGTVTAPFDGTVSSIDYGEDSTAAAGSNAAIAGYLAGSGAAAKSSEGAIATIAPDDRMSVTVGIDETKILSIAVGQRAEVTVSSVSDDVLMGEVTEISRVSASYSGVTQYTAVITLDKLPRMLPGMTATADILIEGVDDVVLIPVDALHRTSSRAYVYTGYDEETKEYTDPVDVTVGVSNSSYVEITSGLNPGDTVYYTEKNAYDFFGMMTGRGNTRRNGG